MAPELANGLKTCLRVLCFGLSITTCGRWCAYTHNISWTVGARLVTKYGGNEIANVSPEGKGIFGGQTKGKNHLSNDQCHDLTHNFWEDFQNHVPDKYKKNMWTPHRWGETLPFPFQLLPSNNTASLLHSPAGLMPGSQDIRRAEKHCRRIHCYSRSPCFEDFISWAGCCGGRRWRGNLDAVNPLKSIHAALIQCRDSLVTAVLLQWSYFQCVKCFLWCVMIQIPAGVQHLKCTKRTTNIVKVFQSSVDEPWPLQCITNKLLPCVQRKRKSGSCLCRLSC